MHCTEHPVDLSKLENHVIQFLDHFLGRADCSSWRVSKQQPLFNPCFTPIPRPSLSPTEQTVSALTFHTVVSGFLQPPAPYTVEFNNCRCDLLLNWGWNLCFCLLAWGWYPRGGVSILLCYLKTAKPHGTAVLQFNKIYVDLPNIFKSYNNI